MARIHMLVGIPGSGKSTYAKILEKQFNYPIVSSDTVRNLHPDWEEALIFPEVYRLCSEYLKNNQDIIFDATNITAKVRKRLIDGLLPYNVNYEIVAYYFPIKYEACLERVSKRNEDKNERFFPLDVLKSYSERIVAPSLEEGFSEIKIIEQTPLKEVANILLEDVVKNDKQGFAFYYEDERGKIEIVQGLRSINSKEKINLDSNFRLASVTKQFIGYGIYLLIKRGKLKYNTLLNDVLYLGDYAKDITIKHLLNHNSGLPDYEGMPHGDEQVSDRDVLRYLSSCSELKFIPGTEYSYSNSGYVLLGLIIEEITHKFVGDYLKEEIFSKVGMNNTVVNIQGVTDIVNRSYGHIYENGELIERDQYWCSATIGDGGIYSSVNDLKKWIDYLMKLYITDKEFFTSNVIDGKNTEYALGIRPIERKGVTIVYHCGGTIGTHTVVGFIPSENKKFVMLTNYNDVDCLKIITNLVKII